MAWHEIRVLNQLALLYFTLLACCSEVDRESEAHRERLCAFEIRRFGKRGDLALGHRVGIARKLGDRQKTAGAECRNAATQAAASGTSPSAVARKWVEQRGCYVSSRI